MKKVLFEENPAADRRYTRVVIGATVSGCLFSAFGLAATIAGLGLFWNEPEMWLFILPLFLSAWTIYATITALCSRRQYIRIYSDRIVYRKQFQKTEGVLHLRPQDYTIRLYGTMYSLRGYSYPYRNSIEFVFLDADGNTLLSYISPTLYASRKSSPRYKWEDDLLSLGCEIIDYEKIIQNK